MTIARGVLLLVEIYLRIGDGSLGIVILRYHMVASFLVKLMMNPAISPYMNHTATFKGYYYFWQDNEILRGPSTVLARRMEEKNGEGLEKRIDVKGVPNPNCKSHSHQVDLIFNASLGIDLLTQAFSTDFIVVLLNFVGPFRSRICPIYLLLSLFTFFAPVFFFSFLFHKILEFFFNYFPKIKNKN